MLRISLKMNNLIKNLKYMAFAAALPFIVSYHSDRATVELYRRIDVLDAKLEEVMQITGDFISHLRHEKRKYIAYDYLKGSLSEGHQQCSRLLFMVYSMELDRNNTVEEVHDRVRHYIRKPEVMRVGLSADGTTQYKQDLFDNACARQTDWTLRGIEDKLDPDQQ